MDGERYEEMALNILSGKGFYLTISDDPMMSYTDKPTILRAPLYPYFIFLIYELLGKKVWVIQLIQVLLSSTTCFIIYSIAKAIYGEKIGNLSAFIFAFFPFFIWYVPRFYQETVFTFLLAVFTYCMLKLLKDLRLRTALLTGIILGVTNLCRSTMLIFPVFLLFFYIY